MRRNWPGMVSFVKDVVCKTLTKGIRNCSLGQCKIIYFSEPEQLDCKIVFIRMRVLAFVSLDPGVRTDMSMCCSRLIHHEAGDVDLPGWG